MVVNVIVEVMATAMVTLDTEIDVLLSLVIGNNSRFHFIFLFYPFSFSFVCLFVFSTKKEKKSSLEIQNVAPTVRNCTCDFHK